MAKLGGDHVQVLVDQYDLTSDHHRIMINDTRKMLETTAFGDNVRKYLPGQRQISLDHRGYMNAIQARSHPALNGATLNGVISIMLGQNAVPTAGDPTYSFEILQNQYSTLPKIGEVIPFTARFTSQRILSGWGIALAIPTEVNANVTSSVINQGVTTNKGGVASLHILQKDSGTGTYLIQVQGSTDNFVGSSTNLATFTLNGGVLGSEQVLIEGNIPPYIRWTAAKTGTDNPIRIAISFNRF